MDEFVDDIDIFLCDLNQKQIHEDKNADKAALHDDNLKTQKTRKESNESKRTKSRKYVEKLKEYEVKSEF